MLLNNVMVSTNMEKMNNEQVTLKEYFNTRFLGMETRLEDISRSLDGLKTQYTNSLSRSDYEAKHELLESKVENLQRMVSIGLGLLLATEFFFRFFLKG